MPTVSNVVTHYTGRVITVETAEVALDDGQQLQRDVVRHPGAVGVVALNDRREVMLIDQYRFPVGRKLLELPAGLLDAAGEPASRTAARELAEEVGLAARRWDLLVEAHTSPGMTDEAIRIYLAREIFDAPASEFERTGEETDLSPSWVDLDTAISMVLNGQITNAMCVMGLLAARHAVGESGHTPIPALRSANVDWPDRSDHSG